MAYWHISGWIKKFYPDLIWDKKGNGKKLYLTFDDGPTPEITDRVLEILSQYNARATFFCLGRNVEHYPAIYQHILAKNHAVGNHTYSHLKGWKTRHKEYFQDIELANQFIHSDLFRPPYGQIKNTQIRHLKNKYKIIMWDVMSHDYENRISKDRSLKAVLRYTKEGSIVVFHDSLKAADKALYILPRVLEEFARKGYTFEAIDE
jgi:peptidoglycan-N-acetylglucosamine deacetylase